jgi:hypothetical protein
MWRSGGIAPPFLTSALDREEWSALRFGRFKSGETAPVPIGYAAECALEAVWTSWRREKSWTRHDSNPGLPAHCPSPYRMSYSDSLINFPKHFQIRGVHIQWNRNLSLSLRGHTGVGQSEMSTVCSVTMFIAENFSVEISKDLYITNKRADVPEDMCDNTHVTFLSNEDWNSQVNLL